MPKIRHFFKVKLLLQDKNEKKEEDRLMALSGRITQWQNGRETSLAGAVVIITLPGTWLDTSKPYDVVRGGGVIKGNDGPRRQIYRQCSSRDIQHDYLEGALCSPRRGIRHCAGNRQWEYHAGSSTRLDRASYALGIPIKGRRKMGLDQGNTLNVFSNHLWKWRFLSLN